jgi:hypothetical protein
MNRMLVWSVAAFVVAGSPLLAQDSSSHCGAAHNHHAAVNERGEKVMGFDHDKTTHHFRLTPSGGVIEVSADDAKDAVSIDAIQGHLAHIAQKFTEGGFEAPMLIHDQVPPGVPVMTRDHARIEWKYEDTETGGQVVVTTKDDEDRKAIHEFLRFQIEDHQTGDSTEVGGDR